MSAQQLANYGNSLADSEDAAAARADVEIEEGEEAVEVDMRGWWKEDGCSEPIAALQGQLIYVRPPSTSAKMSLVLGFDEMFANLAA